MPIRQHVCTAYPAKRNSRRVFRTEGKPGSIVRLPDFLLALLVAYLKNDCVIAQRYGQYANGIERPDRLFAHCDIV